MTGEDKPPFDQTFLDEMKQLLLKAKELLEKEIAVEEEEMINYVSGADVGVNQHPADDATAVHEQTLALTLRNMVAGTLAEVEEALKAIEKGTYGRCSECGAWIDPERLRALPFTDLCIRCAQKRATRFEPPKY